LKLGVLAGLLALVMVGVQARPQAGQETLAQQAIPDAPKPQATLPNLNTVTPGQGTSSTSSADEPSAAAQGTPPSAAPVITTPPKPEALTQPGSDTSPVYEPAAGQGVAVNTTLHVVVNYVDVNFTVKDSKGRLVPGLTGRDVQVYENGVQHPIKFFTSEAFPMSVALVIDQSMTKDEMTRVNDALGALQDAFTPYDEVAVFTYNKSPKLMTDFTGAQSPRLTQAIERSKGAGRDTLMAGSLSGPMAQTTVVNDQNFDPNTAAVHGHTGMALDAPREVHPLNDAILAAATSLSSKPLERRRVIYVISDGKEYGSDAKQAQVIKYLLTNRIEVDGSLVGDSALWSLGTLDRMHLPLMMRDNVLPAYARSTGGNIDSEFRTASIEKSFSKIAGEARYRYTLGYYTNEPFLDGKYRKLEVKVLKPDLTVIAKPGYWPWAMEVRKQATAPTATP
jgi:VWFA-related protein